MNKVKAKRMKSFPLHGKPIELSPVAKIRKEWADKGYDLINITSLCVPKLGYSGWCNDFNEPDEECHHIQIWYRDECIANCHADKIIVLDDDKYILFSAEDCMGDDFIIFRKVKM